MLTFAVLGPYRMQSMQKVSHPLGECCALPNCLFCYKFPYSLSKLPDNCNISWQIWARGQLLNPLLSEHKWHSHCPRAAQGLWWQFWWGCDIQELCLCNCVWAELLPQDTDIPGVSSPQSLHAEQGGCSLCCQRGSVSVGSWKEKLMCLQAEGLLFP